MKIAITGASGFIGKAVVNAARAAEHDVVAIIRSKGLPEWEGDNGIQVASCDLLKSDQLVGVLDNVDVVIHLAAVMQGHQQYEQTLQTTKNLTEAMNASDVKKLIGLGSISVLDYVNANAMSNIDEATPLNTNDAQLGPYALMKRDQERAMRDWQTEDRSLIILRPGLVYSGDQLSDAHVGFKMFASSHSGLVPLVHVDSVAIAAIKACSLDSKIETLHLINDEAPSQDEYIDALKKRGAIGGKISLPWGLYALLMACVRLPLSMIGKVPDSFRKNSVAARQKPFTFSNAKAKELLGWQPVTKVS